MVLIIRVCVGFQQAVDLSIDHKPELELEKRRILLAGGFIHAGRVNGSLNLTRAIGMAPLSSSLEGLCNLDR